MARIALAPPRTFSYYWGQPRSGGINAQSRNMTMTRRHIAAAAALLIAAIFPALLYAQVDISRTLASPKLNAGRTSVVVADAASGSVITQHMPDLALNPASCAKILTSLTALKTLGPDFRFKTVFASDRKPRDGTIGTLYVKGYGDPSLVNEELLKLGAHLRAFGIRRITGGIVIDNSFFDGFDYPRKGGNAGRAYTAPTSALAVNFNSVGVEVAPTRSGRRSKVELKPPIDVYSVRNRVTTGGRTRLGVVMGGGSDGRTITASGRISSRVQPAVIWRSISEPVEYAGAVIAYQFRQAGIEVTGPVRSGRMPSGAHVVAEQFSRPLSEIVYDMMKLSTNFVAEQITKTLGAAVHGAPGSTAKGVRAIGDYLVSIGVPRGEIVLENGSGLSALSRISASQLVRVLIAAYNDELVRDEFVESLSILGVDGTMRSWTKMAPELAGIVHAKTGTLDGVSTLAGYVPMSGSRVAAFAILANGLPKGPWAAKEAQLEIVKSVAGY